jgi:hypothetical protein
MGHIFNFKVDIDNEGGKKSKSLEFLLIIQLIGHILYIQIIKL